MARRRRRIAKEAYDAIYRYVRERGITNAAAIHEALKRELPADKVPAERTVRNVVRELLPPAPSGPWEPGLDNDPEDVALVLEAWSKAISMGWQDEPVQEKPLWVIPNYDMAEWIAWVRRGWPDLDPALSVFMAVDYWSRRESGRSTADLDAYLAFAPWRSPEAYARFNWYVNQGFVPAPPSMYLDFRPGENEGGRER